MNVALVSCAQPAQVDFDAPPLEAAFAARGHVTTVVAWDDPAIDWSRFDAVLLRSTWDYFHRRDAFLTWAAGVAARTALWNPLEIVRWNTHKFYLRELEGRGVAILPTLFLAAGTGADLGALLAMNDWPAAVLKPAVSADSFATLRVERADPAAGQAHLDVHLPRRDLLIQRYVHTVVEPGERCLIFIDGEFSHAVRKRSLFLGGRHAGPEGVAVEAAADEIAAASRVLACTGFAPPLYARVDLLRDEHGTPRLMELELVEPSLFFDARPDSAARLVAGLEARLRSGAKSIPPSAPA